eukprot:Opistho-1_new@55742
MPWASSEASAVAPSLDLLASAQRTGAVPRSGSETSGEQARPISAKGAVHRPIGRYWMSSLPSSSVPDPVPTTPGPQPLNAISTQHAATTRVRANLTVLDNIIPTSPHWNLRQRNTRQSARAPVDAPHFL